MRATFLPFALPDLDDQELHAISAALASGWITTGPKVQQFEHAFAAAVGAQHAVAVNSCTAAMHLALEAIGLQAGDEVITTPYTFAATAEVIRYFDAHPVFVDIDPQSFNLDLACVAAAVTERTRAIIPVHVAGLAVDLDQLYAVAQAHNLAVIEDAAHAFPAAYQGQRIGSSRDGVPTAVCFSFYATKPITTGEGGMICTDSPALAQRCRMMALHGMSKNAWKRYTNQGSWYYEIIAPGYKYNMTDIAAGMGCAQLGKATAMWQRRQWIAACYNAAFGDEPALELPHDRADCQHAWHLYMLRLRPDALALDRNQFIAALHEHNIGTSVHFIPLHLQPYYRDTYGYTPEDFPVALAAYQQEISLPIYSKMSDSDVHDVVAAVGAIIANNRRV